MKDFSLKKQNKLHKIPSLRFALTTPVPLQFFYIILSPLMGVDVTFIMPKCMFNKIEIKYWKF